MAGNLGKSVAIGIAVSGCWEHYTGEYRVATSNSERALSRMPEKLCARLNFLARILVLVEVEAEVEAVDRLLRGFALHQTDVELAGFEQRDVLRAATCVQQLDAQGRINFVDCCGKRRAVNWEAPSAWKPPLYVPMIR